VHHGAVHIESNDIIEYLEDVFPEPALIPSDARNRVHELLQMEDDLHRDLRVLTFRFIIPTPPGQMKSGAALERFQNHDGTIGGKADPHKASEIRFWQAANQHGITDKQVVAAVGKFRAAFEELDTTLSQSTFILGEDLTVADIAWYIYAARVIAAGYPVHRLHQHVGAWFDELDTRPEFHREVEMPAPLKTASHALQQAQREKGQSLEAVAGL
jgi:glutathione S-transferase